MLTSGSVNVSFRLTDCEAAQTHRLSSFLGLSSAHSGGHLAVQQPALEVGVGATVI